MDESEYEERVGQYYQGYLWSRTDILPLRTYTTNVIIAAYELGGSRWLNNFVDETFLSDGRTTIRDYYKSHPERLSTHARELLDRA